MLGPEGENKGDVKRLGNEADENAVPDINYKSQSASRWGLSEDCSRHFRALLLARPELLFRLRPARERFLQLRLRQRSGSAWCPSRQVSPALCWSERLARGHQPPPRAKGRSRPGRPRAGRSREVLSAGPFGLPEGRPRPSGAFLRKEVFQLR